MRILLLGLSLKPECGGGYTFSRDVFEALARTEGHKHEFYVLDFGQLPAILPKTFCKIPISPNALDRRLDWLMHKAILRVKRLMGRGRHRVFLPRVPKGSTARLQTGLRALLTPRRMVACFAEYLHGV